MYRISAEKVVISLGRLIQAVQGLPLPLQTEAVGAMARMTARELAGCLARAVDNSVVRYILEVDDDDQILGCGSVIGWGDMGALCKKLCRIPYSQSVAWALKEENDHGLFFVYTFQSEPDEYICIFGSVKKEGENFTLSKTKYTITRF